ncbi:4-(cytidine 5'-diphospho)-2-C-methyl-D-erythritol kinase [Demequina capsici]|uniref:4-diphosphocytidyl-2-C-methyl-D-erythritol kinase n=1 Tax=Demequina capsici TaxID=3075620 RepID=A0AA96F7I1_9MICO|nr:4-(cytidine 5'-diphospho)-2-C-methyl-D-erythritol kinase [Demequina sp. OYTSA14]WNM25029.1 4-(cytidine 5'-diphospho)-2-C-methyl-D-erythritol kinase [Demequina sp. OYTSA14]
MPRTVTVRAPGKVNLQLAVGARREDGYHPLVTVFQAVALYETVTATARDDERFTLTVSGASNLALDPDTVPLDESNLALRAARAVAERYGISEGIDLQILKGVPVAGGMAGGSADAAAAVVACAEAWDVGASREELHRICAELGADVPFCLHGHTAVGLGRGDELSPAMTHGQFHWVLATQAEGLSTPAVFAELDRSIAAGERTVAEPTIDDAVMSALMAGDAKALGAALSNDLQGPALALAPHLRDVLDAALDADALGAIVSGSGPTVAALARSRQHALAIAAHLTAEGVAGAVLTAAGPAPGATVLAG